jgi:peroxiredoxin
MAGRGTYVCSMVVFIAAAFSVGLVAGVNIAKPEKQAAQPCPLENQKPDGGKGDSGKQQPEGGPEAAAPAYPAAPGFALTGVETGEAISLEDLAGSNVLMLIATTSCPVCRDQIDELKKLYETYKAKGVKFIEAIIGEADESGLRFVDEVKAIKHVKDSGLPFPAFIDEVDEIPANYGVEAVPVLAFITKEGRLMLTRPFTFEADISKILDALITGKPIDISGMKTQTG